MARKVARILMMQNIWFRNQRASDRPRLPAISILGPMEQAGDKVSYQNGGDDFKDNHAGTVTPLAAEALIDKNRSRHRQNQYEPPSIGTFLSRRQVQRCHSCGQANALRNPATIRERASKCV